jgi:release factor glutamine methyltransferase
MTDDDLFLTAILGCSRSDLYTHPAVLTEEQRQRLAQMRQRRAAGEPVQYICGFTDFMGHCIEVGPGVLVPRPETEVWVDLVIQEIKSRPGGKFSALDIGTGSGCIPVALAAACPQGRVVGIDVSAQALAFARRNAVINHVADRIEFIERDVFWFMDETLTVDESVLTGAHVNAQRAGAAGGRTRERIRVTEYDVIVSNPPYIPTWMMPQLPRDVRQEPELALDGGPDGLHFYRFIVPNAWKKLKSGGLLALEFGDGQGKELQNLFAITGEWDKIRIIRDNAGKDRAILAIKK